MARTWRKQAMNKPKGTYWILVVGRNEARQSISLGYVTEPEADRALATMQAEEDAGTVSRVLARHREAPDAAVRYLVGDPAEVELLPAPEVDHGGLTLREYFETCYKPWRAEHRPRSWRGELTSWNRILRGPLATVRLRKIDAVMVADYLDSLTIEREQHSRAGQPASGRTKALHRAAIEALLLRAVRLRHLEQRPELGMFRIEGSTKPSRPRPVPLTLDELVALMSVSDAKHRAMWAVGAGVGLRPSELLRIQWADVDWTARTLVLRGDAQGRGKTEQSTGAVPLTPIAYRELRDWWVRCAQPAEGVAFYSRKPGEPYGSTSGYKRSLLLAAQRADLEHPERVTPYLLRASFATIAWSVGVDKDTARRILRHTNERLLNEVYCRPRPRDLVERVAAFDLVGA